MIRRLLIVNRGEIAVRIQRTCQTLGVETVVGFSEPDRHSLAVRMADQAVLLGPAPAQESYLHIDSVLSAARRTGCDAVHPGYGFLAENAVFAARCREAALLFVGPSPESIQAMASKAEARRRCQKIGLPLVPGSPVGSDEQLAEWAEEIGFPVMLKASAGGGGKGMRRVESSEQLRADLKSARREARKAFGDDAFYLEKALTKARHLEVQVVGDEHGNFLHLGVRECSLQRRHQKVVEECPPPGFSQDFLDRLCEQALNLCRHLNYTNLGTVEFLVEGDEFYFLEMNTRLQVEHPVTEWVTGLDLVEWQLRIAEGAPLPLSQDQVAWRGHSVEARVYAEDPARDFLPTSGRLRAWRPPTQARVDSGLTAGEKIETFYDPMLAKISVLGPDRPSALRQLRRALRQTVLLGVTTNLDFLHDLVSSPKVEKGQLSTSLIRSWVAPSPPRPVVLAMTALRALSLGGQVSWTNQPSRPMVLAFEGYPEVVVENSLYRLEDQAYQVLVSDGFVEVDGLRFPVAASFEGNEVWTHTPYGTFRFRALDLLPRPTASQESHGSLRAPMPGQVVEVLVSPGDEVEENQALLKLEAMKMEHTIVAHCGGRVEAVFFEVGDQVEAEVELVSVVPG